MKKNMSPILVITLSVLISSFVSGTFAYTIALDTIEKNRMFNVVDMKNLSQRLMMSMSDKIKMNEVSLNPELLQIMAENEAQKMINIIDQTSKDRVVFARSSVLFSPDEYDITSRIANSMGLKDVTQAEIDQFVQSTGSQ